MHRYINKNYFDIITKQKANKISMVKIGRLLKKKFDEIFTMKIDNLIIEAQIGPISNRMKMLQGMIIQYFIDKGWPNIEIISPVHKLKNYCQEKLSYNDRKKKAIEVCFNCLKEKPTLYKWSEFYSKNKKKDDLADCFLQGYWYLNNLRET